MKNFSLYRPLLACSISFVMMGMARQEAAAVMPVKDTVVKVIDISTRRQLFVDNYLIDHLGGGAQMQMNHPEAKEVVIEHGEPWEGSYCNNHSIFKDGDIYRMYYAAVHYNVQQGKVIDNEHPFYLCYAESNDGIHWRKPNLGLYEFRGSKQNNIIMTEDKMGDVRPGASSAAMFIDDNPDAAPDAKYKAIIGDYTEIGGSPQGALAFKSRDAIHWVPMHNKPVISGGSFDSQNLGFWDAAHKEYRAYWRYMAGEEKVRSIRTASSKDFINWSNYADLKYVNSPEEHLYNNVIKSYPRSPDIIMGFPIRYIERPWSASMRALPEPEHRKMRSSSVDRFGTALTEGLFMTSRDGVTFNRWNEAFLRPGIERPGTWNYGQQFIGWTMVETKSALEGAPDELSFYATESCWTGNSTLLRRFTMRMDGFVSITAPLSGGELVTKPVTFKGTHLSLNVSTSAAGSVRIELQDEQGKPIPGFTLEDSQELYGDNLDKKVYWKNGSDISSLQGLPVRIRFILKDAALFSFRCQ
ncbi:hypothetical protein [Chitinophaga sp. MM2321]|uniref:hypothetical protein n=1 Tax=Chitinophaga sp. MM2321 TaxID=3137178 RepID=UPI0032D595EE